MLIDGHTTEGQQDLLSAQHKIHLTNQPDESVCLSHSHPTVVQCSLPSAGTKEFFVWAAIIKHVDRRVMSADPRSLCLLGVRLRSVQLIALQL